MFWVSGFLSGPTILRNAPPGCVFWIFSHPPLNHIPHFRPERQSRRIHTGSRTGKREKKGMCRLLTAVTTELTLGWEVLESFRGRVEDLRNPATKTFLRAPVS